MHCSVKVMDASQLLTTLTQIKTVITTELQRADERSAGFREALVQLAVAMTQITQSQTSTRGHTQLNMIIEQSTAAARNLSAVVNRVETHTAWLEATKNLRHRAKEVVEMMARSRDDVRYVTENHWEALSLLALAVQAYDDSLGVIERDERSSNPFDALAAALQAKSD